jgi:hypothetical protein
VFLRNALFYPTNKAGNPTNGKWKWKIKPARSTLTRKMHRERKTNVNLHRLLPIKHPRENEAARVAMNTRRMEIVIPAREVVRVVTADEPGKPLLKSPLLARLLLLLILLLVDRMTQQSNSFLRTTKVNRILQLMVLSKKETRLDTARDQRDSKKYTTKNVIKRSFTKQAFCTEIQSLMNNSKRMDFIDLWTLASAVVDD